MKLYTGHVLDVLPTLPERSVQCVVTSPPYWGLRKYAGEQEVVWGGKEGCEHEWGAEMPDPHKTGLSIGGNSGRIGGYLKEAREGKTAGSFCSLCGAWRGAFGLEPTPALYIEHSMAVLDALRRVLRDDGVLWWNLGDSYATHQKGKGGDRINDKPDGSTSIWYESEWTKAGKEGLKDKDLCLVPFRFALAAQERGWWVRSDIIWSKPNPMPESVTDRPTRAHEYIFLLTKAARYYYDAEAVKERYAEGTFKRLGQPSFWEQKGGPKDGINPNRSCRQAVENLKKNISQNGGRNLRSVWNIATQPYPEAHFATFPPELPRRCILASTSPKACPSCGGPWARVVKHIDQGWDGSRYGERVIEATGGAKTGGTACSTLGSAHGQLTGHNKTLGWKPTCPCPSNDGSGRCVVLDPFCGSGTTVQVAEELNREGWGIDISGEYRELQKKRIAPWQGQKRLI